MNIELKILDQREKGVLYDLLVKYFREIDPSKIIQTTNGEKLDYPYLDTYWNNENRAVFKIITERQIVGFSMINEHVVNLNYNAKKSIAEFYIKPEWRKKGIGKVAAHNLFAMFKGRWEIRQDLKNQNAINFWRHAIAAYTNEDYKEIKMEQESLVIQLFESK